MSKAKQEKIVGWCGWHMKVVNPTQSILVGELESITGKWLPCCKRCWNKRQRLNENIWSGLFNLGVKFYD